MKTNKRFWSYLVQFFLEWEKFQIKFVETIKARILCSVTSLCRKSYRLWDNVEMYVQPNRPQMTIWRVSIACWMLGYKHTLRIRTTYCFSTATIVARTPNNITLYVHCHSCLVCVRVKEIHVYSDKPTG